VSPLDRAGYERQVRTVRVALPEDQFATAWDEGRAMSAKAATEYALANRRPTRRVNWEDHLSDADHPSSPLSAREHDAAALLARGLTNRQIAAELVIAERTASTHVAHILSKLGFSTRTQIAAWVVERGLTVR
jgi:non-specific serine/threonine protein kinase